MNNRLTRLLTLIFLALSFYQAQAQRGTMGFHATVNEYDGDLNGNEHQFYQFNNLIVGGAFSLQQYINQSFNLMEKFSYNRMIYNNSDHTVGIAAEMFSLNLKLRYKFNNGYLIKEDAAIAPFLMGGIGVTRINSNVDTELSNAIISDKLFKANVALGIGILFQLTDRVGVEFANTINAPLYDGWDGVTLGENDLYLQYSAGLIFSLKKPTDIDKDGVPDKKDKCADTPSNAVVDSTGCPIDSDADGVADYLDTCPNVAGLTQFNGCPDSDGDGGADKDDKCPDVPGVVRFAGCPNSGGDGIQDSENLMLSKKQG